LQGLWHGWETGPDYQGIDDDRADPLDLFYRARLDLFILAAVIAV
jgi:hypothetical protein